jgi:hypothetical protein
MGDKGSSVLFPHKSVYRELEDSTTIGLASFFADASFLFNKQEYVKKIRLKILSVENSEDGRFYLSELLLLCP